MFWLGFEEFVLKRGAMNRARGLAKGGREDIGNRNLLYFGFEKFCS